MPKRLKTLEDLPPPGGRVLVRVDFNVSVGSDGEVDGTEDYRISSVVPTLRELAQRGDRVIILPRRGREDGDASELDLTAVHRRLEELMGQPVPTISQLTGEEAVRETHAVEPGHIVMLPNVRRDRREVEVSDLFADELAQLGEAYVSEAFSEAHRSHTSLTLLPHKLPSVAGRRCELEVRVLHQVVSDMKRPYVVLVSGAKLHDKIGMLRRLAEVADYVCIGGKIANVFLAAEGKLSPEHYPPDEVAAAQSLLQLAARKIRLPQDIVTGAEDGSAYVRVVPLAEINDGLPAWDVGPATVKEFLEVCKLAQTIVWNGPMGRCEAAAYCTGTTTLAEGLSRMQAFRVVGGGDLVNALQQARMLEKFDHASVGGGAMIAFLEGKRMPGLEALYTNGQD